ncbi:unnamed protein product, partial [Prorocentrum cordatum]
TRAGLAREGSGARDWAPAGAAGPKRTADPPARRRLAARHATACREARRRIFLAVAVVANAGRAVLASDRSTLPELLTSLGMSSREDLEGLWSTAEGLHNRTPATFTARLRRNVLRFGASTAAPPPAAVPRQSCERGGPEERDDSEGAARLLDKLERERCFFILPEEVVGHCYPARAGEARRPWQPAPACPWRLIVLDLRPRADFDAARLPAALHFDPLRAPAGAPPGGTWAVGR